MKNQQSGKNIQVQSNLYSSKQVPQQSSSYYTQPTNPGHMQAQVQAQVQARKNAQDRFTENTTVMGIGTGGKEPGQREPTPVYVP